MINNSFIYQILLLKAVSKRKDYKLPSKFLYHLIDTKIL